MKILKYVCSILLMLSGAELIFVGAVGSWESLTSNQPAGLVLMLPTAGLGMGLIWLGTRLLRGRLGNKTQEKVPLEQEKDGEEIRKKDELEMLEKRRRERLLQKRQRWLAEQWLEERPTLKAQFNYLQAMMFRNVLSFYDPSGKAYGSMFGRRNHTGGEWMRTLPAYDLEQVVTFYQDLWDAKDHLTQDELDHAPNKLRCTLNALTHRRLYLRLNSEHQLTTLDDQKDTLLERCREQDVHLVLQPCQNEIIDLTDGVVYALHTEEMGVSFPTDEIVGGEVTLVPTKRTVGSQERESCKDRRGIAPDQERYGEMLDQIGIDEDAEQMLQEMPDLARMLVPANQVLIARLERMAEAFSSGLLNALRYPPYIERSDMDRADSDVSISCAIAPYADLDQVIDIWLDFRAAKAELAQETRRDCDAVIEHLNFFLANDRQPERSANRKETLLRRCQESGISLILNLGDRCYQDLDTGKFYTFVIEDHWIGSTDDEESYEELEWHEIPPLPPRPEWRVTR